MATTGGWKNRELWNAKGARQQLRRRIQESKAARAASVQARVSRESIGLEQRRDAILRAANQLSGNTPPEVRDAVTQAILQFYRDAGELERKARG